MSSRWQKVPAGQKSVRNKDRYLFPVKNKDFTLSGHLFGERLEYDFNNPDFDDDWLKWAGVQLDLYKPHKRTTMVAFRYRKEHGWYEWTFYHHGIKNTEGYKEVGKYKGYYNPDNVIILPIGMVPDWKVNFVGKSRRKIELTLEFPEGLKDVINPSSPNLELIDRYLKFQNSKHKNFIKSHTLDKITDTIEFDKFGRWHTRGNIYLGGDMPWTEEQGDLTGIKKYKKGL